MSSSARLEPFSGPRAETAFQNHVRSLASMLGWRTWHVADSRKVTKRGVVGDKGIADFPDLVLVKVNLAGHELLRPCTCVAGGGTGRDDGPFHVHQPIHGRVMFRELKVKARVTPGQQEALDQLRAAGADADVWRPADLESGRIEAELKGAPWTP